MYKELCTGTQVITSTAGMQCEKTRRDEMVTC